MKVARLYFFPWIWRVLGFGVAVALGVTLLFGLAPALRASGVKPSSALKGGDPHLRPRMMQLLVAAQLLAHVAVQFLFGNPGVNRHEPATRSLPA
jgi:putative ABC transport system permease protein